MRANAVALAPPFAARIASVEIVTKSALTTNVKSLSAIGATMTRTAELVAKYARIISARSLPVIFVMTIRIADLVARYATCRNSNAKSPNVLMHAFMMISASLAEKNASMGDALRIALHRSK